MLVARSDMLVEITRKTGPISRLFYNHMHIIPFVMVFCISISDGFNRNSSHSQEREGGDNLDF